MERRQYAPSINPLGKALLRLADNFAAHTRKRSDNRNSIVELTKNSKQKLISYIG